MKTHVLKLDTSSRQFVDITQDAISFCEQNGADGLLNVFVPHATAGLAIMETGSGSERDLAGVIDDLLPRSRRWTHSHGSPGHGADHLLPAFLAPSVTIPVVDGRPALGTWQSIVLVDFNADNPSRSVRLTFQSFIS
jgi:secondary thiamine-phosphate synthase enzyme